MTSPLTELRQIVARLRAPDGCPWDREQTPVSLRSCVLEEAHEVVEAIGEGDAAHLCEELGDLLLTVVMHAQLAAEAGQFDLDAVARGICEKLVRRHPHVFGASQVTDAQGVMTQWDAIKRTERGQDKTTSLLAGVSTALPALMQAQKLAKKAAKVGFDWGDTAPVVAKIREELAETEEALASDGPERQRHVEEEIGDLLFTVVNLARHAKVDAEVALRGASGKFQRRFQRVEAILQERGVSLAACGFEEMDAVWDAVKIEEKA